MKAFYLAIMTTLLLGAMLPATVWAEDVGPVYSGTVKEPKNDGKDEITVRYKEGGQGANKFLTPTADIKKDDTPQAKARKIAKAINDDPANRRNDNGTVRPIVRATAVGDQVLVVGQDGDSIEKFQIRSKSGQGKVKVKKISNGADAVAVDGSQDGDGLDGSADGAAASEALLGAIAFEGAITGIDGDGEPAYVRAGTGRGTVVRNTAAFFTVEDLVATLMQDLSALGIAVLGDSPTSFQIVLSTEDEEEVVIGSTDLSLDVTGSIEKLD